MKLKDLGEYFIGLTYKPEDVSDKGTIVLRSGNIQDGQFDLSDIVRVDTVIREKQFVKPGDILMCSRNGSARLVGKSTIIPTINEPMTFGAFMTVFRTPYNDYLKYFLQSRCFRAQLAGSKTTTINQITIRMLDGIDIDLPDNSEREERIKKLEILQSMIRFRKQELRRLDDLIKARFVEMFGDPMINNKGYELRRYGDLFELNAGGTPSKMHSEYWDGGTIPWIGSNMCQNTYIYGNDGYYITEEGFNHSSAKMFPVDTVLVALVGATIGKTALLKFETTTNQNVLGIRGIREKGYTPEFVYYYTQGLNKKFLELADGGFAMASKGFISDLLIPLVDLESQEAFTLFANKVDKSKLKIQAAIDVAQSLFNSLMQQYFG